MNIKNKRGFIAGVISIVLMVTSVIIYILNMETRFLIASVVLFVLGFINFNRAFSKKGILEEIKGSVDERDQYLTMRTSHLLVGITNYVLMTLIFIFLIAYGAWKSMFLLTIAITLCAVLCFLFLGYLTINIYLERNE